LERTDIIKFLAGELRSGTKAEREVASAFLREVLIRRDEPVRHKAIAISSLTANWVSETYRSQLVLIKRGYYLKVLKNLFIAIKNKVVLSIKNFSRDIFWDEIFSESVLKNVMTAGVALVLVASIGDWKVPEDINTFTPTHYFVDMEETNWEEEMLATLSFAEKFDEVLTESRNENMISDLLDSGRHYERLIRVTGYYSPLPDQERYATGSYRGDIKLNGRGVRGADETPVYLGMAAGPPHLDYGTKLIIRDLEGHDMPNIYTVHDRGSAIVGNRIDIWMGEGVEAMDKAYEISGYYKVIIVEEK
jgi:3D (Asp-Asp-Asp) domain-containing protein